MLRPNTELEGVAVDWQTRQTPIPARKQDNSLFRSNPSKNPNHKQLKQVLFEGLDETEKKALVTKECPYLFSSWVHLPYFDLKKNKIPLHAWLKYIQGNI